MPESHESFWRYSATDLAAAMTAGFTTTPFLASLPTGAFSMAGFFGLELLPFGNADDGTFSIDIEHYVQAMPNMLDAFGTVPSDGVNPCYVGRKIGTLAVTLSDTLTGVAGTLIPATMFGADGMAWTPAADAAGGLGDILTEFTSHSPTVANPGSELIGGWALRDFFSPQFLRLRHHTLSGATAINTLVRRIGK